MSAPQQAASQGRGMLCNCRKNFTAIGVRNFIWIELSVHRGSQFVEVFCRAVRLGMPFAVAPGEPG